MIAQLDLNFIRARPWKIWSRLVAYLLFEGRPLTTRGRWINPIVFAGHKLWAILPFRHREIAPIFILGTGRSGTTVLGTILGFHREVGYLNEPKALWHAALGDDDLVGSFCKTPGRYKMERSDADPGKVRRLHNSYRAFLNLTHSNRVVDKYPELIFRNCLLDAAFPGACKIVLLRNGADTIRSIQTWSEKHVKTSFKCKSDWWGQDQQKWHLLVRQLVLTDPYFGLQGKEISKFRNQVDMAAVEWIVTMREAVRLRNAAKPGMIFVRYEDLVAQPRETLSEIVRFSGLGHDEKMLDYGVTILKQRSAFPVPSLDPVIAPLFCDTMKLLGYPV